MPDNFEEPRRGNVDKTRGDLTRPKNPNMSIKRIWREWLVHQTGDVRSPEEVFESINWNYTPYKMLPQNHPKHGLSFGDETDYLDIDRDFDKYSDAPGDDVLWGSAIEAPIE